MIGTEGYIENSGNASSPDKWATVHLWNWQMPAHLIPFPFSIMQPNFLVFFTDQQRWDSTGVHGNPLNLTPNFDRLCRTGTHLSHHFTCQPVCGPARACLQTGTYATQNGTFHNGLPLTRELPTLAQLFKSSGYETGYIGKWHLSDKHKGPVPEEDRSGYEYWLASNVLEWTSDAYATRVYNEENEEVFLPGYRVDALTDAAIRYMARPRNKPFFLFTSFLEPHHQNHRNDFPGPDGYEEQFTGRWTPPDLQTLGGNSARQLGGYWGMVKRLDEAFGRVIDALKSLGQLDNTIVLFTSDHGCHFATRNDEYKRSPHDSSLRVPTLFHGPGFEGGQTFQPLTSLVDLPPTLLDAANIPIPETMSGRSLLPEVRGETRRSEDDDFIIAQISESQHGRAIRTRRWKYAISAAWTKSPHPERYREEFLYDLQADPWELDNLIGMDTFSAITSQLRDKLIAKLKEIGEPDIPIDLAPARFSGQREPDVFHVQPA